MDTIFTQSPLFTRLLSQKELDGAYAEAMAGQDRPSAVFWCDGDDMEDGDDEDS